MTTMSDFLEHFRAQRRGTLALVAAIPESQFGWRPAEQAFSCGELVRHLIQSEVFWRRLLVAGARGEAYDPFGLQGSGDERLRAFRPRNLEGAASPKLGTSFAECLSSWREIQRTTEAELAAIPDAALRTAEVTHPLLDVRRPLWEMLLVMLEHEIHHRGQLSAYLKALGVEQPAALAYLP